MKSGLPKVLHTIGSRPMISYVVEAAKKTAPKKIIAVVARKRLEVRDALGNDIKVAIQEKQLGTADAVRAAVKDIPPGIKDVVVLYGDTPLITPETVQGLYDYHLARGASCTVLSTFLENPRGYGRILRNEAGQLIGIIEDRDANFKQKSIKEINTGLYCFKKDDLLEGLEHIKPANAAGEFYLTDVFSWFFNKNKRIEASVSDNFQEVLGVNSRAELMEAAQVIRKRILLKHIERGVLIDDLSTVFVDETAEIGEGSRILPFTVIEEGVSIGCDCRLGPFAHLRPGVILKDRAKVGNFAEVKNSVLDTGSVMNHFGYLGDTAVGKNVNIGAGVVVANFDGKKKNKTVIKDKAFIGCDSVLIAPVVIGRKAVVGAGSIVTKGHNVADGEIVVGIPARPVKKK